MMQPVCQIPEHFPPSLSTFRFLSSNIHNTLVHRLLITSLLTHPRSPICRFLHGKDFPSILLYSPPPAPQLSRLSHTSALSANTPTATATASRPIDFFLTARWFHVWAKIRRFEFSKDELDGVELFGVAVWYRYFDFDLEGVDVADWAAEGARKEGADAGGS